MVEDGAKKEDVNVENSVNNVVQQNGM
jgi:hypothetical protein